VYAQRPPQFLFQGKWANKLFFFIFNTFYMRKFFWLGFVAVHHIVHGCHLLVILAHYVRNAYKTQKKFSRDIYYPD